MLERLTSVAPGGMERFLTTAEDVTEANRRFYDRIAPVYDHVDSRRGGKVDHGWLDRVLEGAIAATSVPRPQADWEFVDAGAGSGFLAERARRYFRRITLLDLSGPMLQRIALKGARRVQGDACRMPLRDASVDFVGAFATLHHLYSPAALFGEAFRVLRPGGVLYCDHDIDRTFVTRFRLPLRLYRAVFDHGHEYLRRCPDASARDYALSEFHGETGLSAAEMAGQLRAIGFEVLEARTHWEGLGAPSRLVKSLGLGPLLAIPGWSPVGRLIARKSAPRS